MKRKILFTLVAVAAFLIAAPIQHTNAQTPSVEPTAAIKLLFKPQAKAHEQPTPQPTPVKSEPLRFFEELEPIDPCENRTVLTVVAHEDDDLLFVNPAIGQAITRGDCVRTVYLTAGDAGQSAHYVKSREEGVKSAYQTMAGSPLTWNDAQSQFGDRSIATSTPAENPNITLMFMQLPDGNIDGKGFASTLNQSLATLRDGALGAITTVDGTTQYTSADLINTLSSIITHYDPITINTLADHEHEYGDHSDHIATGDFINLAAAQAGDAYTQRTLHFRGYNISYELTNVSPEITAQKAAAFFAYASYDPGVCRSIEECVSTNSSYAYYLFRQYAY